MRRKMIERIAVVFIIIGLLIIFSYPTTRLVSVVFDGEMYEKSRHEHYTKAQKIVKSRDVLTKKLDKLIAENRKDTARVLGIESITYDEYQAVNQSMSAFGEIKCSTRRKIN
jgi:cell division protein FtsI/penicillin-binding protein 2